MDYHEMEAAMNQAIRVALRQETPNQTLEVLLELLGKTMEADRTYIFEKNDHGHDDNTYEWAARGVIPERIICRICLRRFVTSGIRSSQGIRIL